jgi:hypothetical protein
MTLPSPSDESNCKLQIADTVYEEKLRQSFAYYSENGIIKI